MGCSLSFVQLYCISLIVNLPSLKFFPYLFGTGYGLNEICFSVLSLLGGSDTDHSLTAQIALLAYFGHGVHHFFYPTGSLLGLLGCGVENFRQTIEEQGHSDNSNKQSKGIPLVKKQAPPLHIRVVITAVISGIYTCQYQPLRFAWLYPELLKSKPVFLESSGLMAASMAFSGALLKIIADIQKLLLRSQDPEAFCTTGLYGFSRHPNYLGELMLRQGLGLVTPLFVWPVVSVKDWGCLAAGVLGNLVIGTSVIVGENGPVHMVEKRWAEQHKNDRKYLEYIARVGRILPRIS
eukprot:gnl/MRDRNA2_/MRDRNA2_34048_c0_seq1.p1 gnl/MRDRNA2_/MRDRNA2_34048_c0~~gnl/MRDRNA2_/MRDRNA2_34048_c0_seq1.p1  ORF type:complete len:293 (-),score=27.14 gnl/MRDRNA2_/MRDRNA2_34048_c0_seq1:19-897(-)